MLMPRGRLEFNHGSLSVRLGFSSAMLGSTYNTFCLCLISTKIFFFNTCKIIYAFSIFKVRPNVNCRNYFNGPTLYCVK